VQLKIPNFSKLSKADLIAKILEATSGKATDSATHPPSQGQAPAPSSKELTASKDASGDTDGPPKKKEGNVKKRKATDQAGPPIKSPREEPNKTAEGATETTQPQAEVIPSTTTTSIDSPILSAIPTGPSAPTKTVKTKDKVPKSKAAKKIPAPTPTPTQAAEKPTSKSKAHVATQSKSTSKAPLAKSSTIAQGETGPTPPTFWKTQAAGTTESKSRCTKLVVNPVRPRFTGLISNKSAEAPAPTARPEEVEIDLSTITARIKFVESQFLNTLFTLLHQYRAKSITDGYPSPPSFTKSPKYKQTSHLAFQGFHPEVYDTKDGFQVAIRFWIARLHSYMQLGSGEAWSGSAGGMGMLGPDMATWPPVIGVEKVTEEVWAIKTEEEDGEVKYLVMGEIGEVVASSKGITGDEALVNGCVVRSDWAKYLESEGRKTLVSMVKTKESYDFPNGVARAWAARQPEGMVKIAYRAVLASCALNR
jgi:hypothetical protein